MLHNTPDLHSQRPDYQKDNIDFALSTVQEVLSELEIYGYVLNPNHIIILFWDLNIEWWSYNWNEDSIYIDFRNSFNLDYYIHETVHGFSSSKRDSVLQSSRPRNWFSGEEYDFDWFCEWITESITLQIIHKHRKKVQEILNNQNILRKKYKELWVSSWDIFAEDGYGNGSESMTYILEMTLVNCFIDLLSYKMQDMEGVSFEKAQKILWQDIQSLFFLWDKNKLFQFTQSVDKSWKIWSWIEKSDSWSEDIDVTLQLIVNTIQDIYEPDYKVDFNGRIYTELQ